MMTLETIATKNIKQSMHQIQNPGLVFENVFREINTIFKSLFKQYGATFSDFDSFLTTKEPEIKANLTKLEQKINSNVYGLFRNSQLSTAEYNSWQKSLIEWKKLHLSALRFFEICEFGHDMVTHKHSN
jgi:hypothetical protein